MTGFKKFIPKIEYETTGNDTFKRYIKLSDSRSEYNFIYNITKGKLVSNSGPDIGNTLSKWWADGTAYIARNNTRIKINERPVTAWASVIFHPIFGECSYSNNNNI